MKNLISFLAITLFFTTIINAQPSVAICGWDASGSSTSGDEVSFVLLRDFAAGEILYITEDEYSDAANNFLSGEGHIAFTVPAGGLLENDVVNIQESSSGVYTDNCGSGGTAVHVAGSGGWSLVADGLGGSTDEVYVYSASDSGTPWSSVTEIHSFAWGANNSIPADQNPSSDWPNCIILDFNIGGPAGINADFLDAARVAPTIAIFLDPTNWNSGSAALVLSCTDFTNQMLPIELISFDARLKRHKVELDWVTATEINNERFEVEHSTDGKNFTSIGSIKGNGTSNVTNSYEMTHYAPSAGMNYYRLKQIDFDGLFSYSDIEAVRYEKNNKQTSVYPNPFAQDVTLQFSGSDQNSIGKIRTIEIYDIYGRLALKQDIPIEKSNVTLDLSNLNSGAYFLHTLNNQTQLSEVERIIKL